MSNDEIHAGSNIEFTSGSGAIVAAHVSHIIRPHNEQGHELAYVVDERGGARWVRIDTLTEVQL